MTVGELLDSGRLTRKTEVVGDVCLIADKKLIGKGAWLYGVVNRGTPKVSCGRVSVYATGTGCAPVEELFADPDNALEAVPAQYRDIA